MNSFEFDLEVSFPVRVIAVKDDEGRWECTGLLLTTEQGAHSIPWEYLVPAEQRTVLRKISEEAGHQESERNLERQLCARERQEAAE